MYYYLLLFLVLMCLLAKAVHGGDLPRLELGRLEELGERQLGLLGVEPGLVPAI